MRFGTKEEARAFYRAMRDGLGEAARATIDAAIAERVVHLPAFEAADAVFAYLSVAAEVDTRRIIRTAWAEGKTVAVPRCVPGTRQMNWHRIDAFEGLARGSFGIEEPPDDPATMVDVPQADGGIRAIALVPGFAFDPLGFRLGYGGGFYDTFLPAFGGTSVGLCRACQFSAEPLPRDAHDVPVSIVATDTGTTAPR